MTSVRLDTIDPKKHPYLALMATILRNKHRFAADSIERGMTLFGKVWATEFEQIVSTLFPSAEAIAAAAKGYAAFEYILFYMPKSRMLFGDAKATLRYYGLRDGVEAGVDPVP